MSRKSHNPKQTRLLIAKLHDAGVKVSERRKGGGYKLMLPGRKTYFSHLTDPKPLARELAKMGVDLEI
jgi:hypothetical protein